MNAKGVRDLKFCSNEFRDEIVHTKVTIHSNLNSHSHQPQRLAIVKYSHKTFSTIDWIDLKQQTQRMEERVLSPSRHSFPYQRMNAVEMAPVSFAASENCFHQSTLCIRYAMHTRFLWILYLTRPTMTTTTILPSAHVVRQYFYCRFPVWVCMFGHRIHRYGQPFLCQQTVTNI